MTTAEAVAETTEGNALTDVEARARAQGWRPKDEYKGPPERWRDAEAFLDVAETVMPVAVERNRVMEEKFTRTEAELRAVRGEVADLKGVLSDYQAFASRGEERAYQRARKELLAQRDAAIQHADTNRFREIDAEINDLDKSVEPVKKPAAEKTTPNGQQQAAPDPTIVSWIADNPWFNTDTEMQSYAQSVDAHLMRTKPGMSVSDRLAAVKTKTRNEFPDKFGNATRDAPSSVAAPSGGNGKKPAKHSYENLPPAAKAACDKFVKTIPGFKREDYVRDYEWD